MTQDTNNQECVDFQSVLTVCTCKSPCDPSYPSLESLEGMRIMLHHINEEDNELGVKGDVVKTPIKLLSQKLREEICDYFIKVAEDSGDLTAEEIIEHAKALKSKLPPKQ